MELRGGVLLLLPKFVANAKVRIWTEDKRLIEVLNYIQSHIDREIKVDDLASIVCVAKSHFIRLFTKNMGESPLAYVNKKKIERAQVLLVTED